MDWRSSILLSILFVFGPHSAFGDWSGWRGSDRDGVVSAGKAWPDSLDEKNLELVWSAPLSEGYSAPVTADGRVFTFETSKKESEVIRAFDLESGNPLWDLSWTGSMKVPFFAAKNGSWVRSTPTVNGGAIYAGGMRDVLVKVDAATGEEMWRIDFTERESTEVPAFGQVCSPLFDGGFLYVQAGLAVAKLDAETGETLWRAMEDRRAMFGSAFSSPVIATLGGRRQLVVQGRLELAGLDLETGTQLWNIPVKAFRGMNILTPTVVGNDRIFTASYGGGAFLFEVGRGDVGGLAVEQVWNNPKLEGYMGNPAFIDGHIYLHGRDKRLHCIDLADGGAKWSTGEEFGEYWSMIRNQGRILALDQGGELILFDASPEEFRLLDRRVISTDESTWAHVGFDGNRVLVRSLKSVSVFRWSAE